MLYFGAQICLFISSSAVENEKLNLKKKFPVSSGGPKLRGNFELELQKF